MKNIVRETGFSLEHEARYGLTYFSSLGKVGIILISYPPEVRRGKYWRLGVFLLQYFLLARICKYCIIMHKYEFSWVVKIRNTSETVRQQYILSHYTECGPIGLGRYISLGEYCGPHTDSSVFLISSLNCLNKRGYPYVWTDVQYVEI